MIEPRGTVIVTVLPDAKNNPGTRGAMAQWSLLHRSGRDPLYLNPVWSVMTIDSQGLTRADPRPYHSLTTRPFGHSNGPARRIWPRPWVDLKNFEWLDDRVCPGTIGRDMGADLETRSRSEEEGKRCKSVAVPPL